MASSMLFRLVSLVLAASLLPGLALGAEKLPIEPDPKGEWRRVDYFYKTDQFICADRMPRRAICAIELVIACEMRQGETDDCERVRFPTYRSTLSGTSTLRTRFRVEEVRLIDDMDIWHAKRFMRHRDDGPDRLMLGDLMVMTRQSECYSCVPRKGGRVAYRLRLIDGLWKALWWGVEYMDLEDDTTPEDIEAN
jgi:hypothetical protein